MIAVRTLILASLMGFSLETCSAQLIGDQGFNMKLNCIQDVTNPSNGACFLDMSYSAGLNQVAALVAAQADYPTARVATRAEFDHMFLAAGISYDGTTTASDAFEVGPTEVISSGSNYDGGALATVLGPTSTGASMLDDVFIFTDPDVSTATFTTRDILFIGGPSGTVLAQVQQSASIPPSSTIGHLLIQPAAIPEPSSFCFLGIVAILIGLHTSLRASRRRPHIDRSVTATSVPRTPRSLHAFLSTAALWFAFGQVGSAQLIWEASFTDGLQTADVEFTTIGTSHTTPGNYGLISVDKVSYCFGASCTPTEITSWAAGLSPKFNVSPTGSVVVTTSPAFFTPNPLGATSVGGTNRFLFDPITLSVLSERHPVSFNPFFNFIASSHTVTAVPEPGAFLFMGLVAVVLAARHPLRRWWTQ